jgi:hypothetical protein
MKDYYKELIKVVEQIVDELLKFRGKLELAAKLGILDTEVTKMSLYVFLRKAADEVERLQTDD